MNRSRKKTLLIFHFGHRRQSSACFRDYQETLTQRFTICNNVLEEIQDAEILPLNATTTFCRERCPSYLIRLAQKLTVDCGLPDTLVRICDRGYCIAGMHVAGCSKDINVKNFFLRYSVYRIPRRSSSSTRPVHKDLTMFHVSSSGTTLKLSSARTHLVLQ